MSSEEVELLSDSKYRQFIAAVEKALKYFESSDEWADLISALGKLNKVLVSNSKFSIIPRKLMIGKRLSQCTHPALPSGVHLKALEVYSVIFQRIGKKRLAQDLFIYGAGLFPLMGHAAMSVKPLLMKLYEDHFLPLGIELLPGLPGLLLALLPGIEEGSDYTERTITLLEAFSSSTDKDIFFEALWQSMITTPTVRLPGTIFLLSQLDKRLATKGQRHVMGKNHAFMVQGVCLSLNDAQSLVQRNLLDFLVQHLPLHLSLLPQSHLSAIMTAGLGVLLRRDMSLNRRLYTWILGMNSDGSQGLMRSDSTNEDDMMGYFEMHSKTLVVMAMRNLFRQHIGGGGEGIMRKKGSKLELLKPFRIFLNLLDKPEIGSAILEDVLIEVFKNLFQNWQYFGSEEHGREQQGWSGKRDLESGIRKENSMEELIKTANLLFNTFEPYFMWQYIAKLLAQCRERRLLQVLKYENAPSGESDPEVDGKKKDRIVKEKEMMDEEEKPEMIDVIRLTDFILNIVALEASVETESKHWPELLAEIIQELTKGCQSLTFEELEEGILLCSKLLSKVTPSTNVVLDHGTRSTSPRGLYSLSFNPDNGGLSDVPESPNESSSLHSGLRDEQSHDGRSPDMESHDITDKLHDEQSHDNMSPDIWSPKDMVKSHDKQACDSQSLEDNKSHDESRDQKLSVDDNVGLDGITHASEGPTENEETHAIKERSLDVRDTNDYVRVNVDGHVWVNGELFQTPRFKRDVGIVDENEVNGLEEVKGMKIEGKGEEVQERRTTKDVKKKKDGSERTKSEGKTDAGKRRKSSEVNEVGKERKSTKGVQKKEKRKDSMKEDELDKKEKKKENRRDSTEEEVDKKDKKKDKKKEREVDKKKKKRHKTKKRNIENEKDEDSVTADEIGDAGGQLGIEHVSQSALIRNCITHFQTFVLEFFRCKILHSEKCKEFLEKDGLRKIKGLNTRSEERSKDTSPGVSDEHSKDTSPDVSDEHCDSAPSRASQTYAAACKLLVELSCFPMQNKGTECESVGETTEKDKPSLPSWLRCLIVCCCEIDDFDIQSTSVATLLDLINLTLSVSSGASGGSAGVTVIPILTFQEVMIIEKSNIYQVIANNLWCILGRPLTIHHRKAVELLIELHNLTPSPYLCENVIGSSIVSDCKDQRLEALKRFANLWHIAKSILSQNVGRTARGLHTFDRSLFVMLDGLESEEPEIRSLTKMWVSHSLEQGDIGRILEPLLLLLLHPSTARVSHYYSEREKTKVDTHVCKEVETEKLGECEEGGEEEREKYLDGEDDGVKENTEDIEYEEDIDMSEELTEEVNTDFPSTSEPQNIPSYSRLSDIHKLHYSGKCDYQRILYAFRTLSCVLRVVPRQFVCAAAATSIGSSFGPYEERIKELLIRHKHSLLGKGFYGPLYGNSTSHIAGSASEGPAKFTIKPNTSKYLEILITISLYFIRSHYLPASKVEPEFIEGNIKTQVSSLECLSNLIWELVKLVRESGHGFGNFITDLLSRCKVQKAIVHCLAATTKCDTSNPDTSRGSSDNFHTSRDNIRVPTETAGVSKGSSKMPPEVSRSTNEASRKSSIESVDHMILQSKLLELVESLIVLEHTLLSCFEALTPDHLGNTDFEIIMKGGDEGGSVDVSRFIQGKSLSSQEMLLNMVVYSLKAQGNIEMKSRWTGFVIDCLPYLGCDLKKWVVPVVLQMCSNLFDVAMLFEEMSDTEKKNKSLPPPNKQFPPDHLLAVLAGLTSICHFCLLEAVSSPVLGIQPRAGSTVVMAAGQAIQVDFGPTSAKSNNSMQILTNLLHAFSSNSKTNEGESCMEHPTPLLEAREGLLSVLPRIVSTLLALWGTWNLVEPSKSLPSSMALLGTAKALRQSILQLLTPIAMTHTIVFVASIADVWNFKKPGAEKDTEGKSTSFLTVNEDQLRIITLVLDIKALSLEVVIDTVKQILHQEKVGNRQPGFEASLFHFFHEFLLRSPLNHISQVKSSFLALLKDGLQLNLPPPAIFLLLVNLHSYYQKVPGKDDRKSRKDSQDVAQRLIEACTTVAGLSLESSAWFGRNLSVISVPDPSADEVAEESEVVPTTTESKSDSTGKSGAAASKHSTQALVVLSEILATLLDMVFGREEKERVVNFLIQVMGNVTPYLRNHSVANVPSFRACCSLVASLSGYEYTRKAWRKEMFELFFEPSFFQMEKECVGMWCTIVDNLFTQDQASFRELVARATVTPSAAMSFFGNHEQEMQQRALMLKRLAFTVFSSEPDQYESSLLIIQERLAECLRMPQVPVLHDQVFLFFRVLLVRMSNQLTFIWPMVISEMIHVFLLLESDLLQSDTASREQQMFYSETVLGASGYVNYSQEKWLGLYLSVCKLLDMALCLPPEQLPQFQMYRWAFEGTANDVAEGSHVPPEGSHVPDLVTVFTPYVSRIRKLLEKRKNIYVSCKPLECHAGRPLLTMYQLESVEELLPFLRLLSTEGRIISDMRSSEKGRSRKPKDAASKNFIERLLERDFLEPMKE